MSHHNIGSDSVFCKSMLETHFLLLLKPDNTLSFFYMLNSSLDFIPTKEANIAIIHMAVQIIHTI